MSGWSESEFREYCKSQIMFEPCEERVQAFIEKIAKNMGLSQYTLYDILKGRVDLTPEAERDWVRSRQRKSRPPEAAPEERLDMHACCARIGRLCIARGERKRAEKLIRDIILDRRDAWKTLCDLERESGGQSPAVMELRA